MLTECVDAHNSELPDWRMWAVSRDMHDDNPLVMCGSFSSDFGEEWKNWRVEDPDWESDVSSQDGRKSEFALLQMKQVLAGKGFYFRDSNDVLSGQQIRTGW